MLGGLILSRILGAVTQVLPLDLFALGLAYIFFGWLFGGYTILRARWINATVLFSRQLCIAVAAILSFLLFAWVSGDLLFVHPLLSRTLLVLLFAWQTIYGFLLRLVFHPALLQFSLPDWQLLAREEEYAEVIRQWQHNPSASLPIRVDAAAPRAHSSSLLYALGSRSAEQVSQPALVRDLRRSGFDVTTLEQMARFQLERLPPTLLPEQWMAYSDLRWSNALSFQRQLKRASDILIASALLVLLAPVLIVAACLIWLEDGGPIFYVQRRSGWRNQSFALYKLRTMRHSPSGQPTPWTSPSDSRITQIGQFLRRTRLDEIPQLINVIRGEMSLIGPRPEQPHIDLQLGARIPHYHKRYWMPPGLSGWAQVCGPAYPATFEEAELKLSYDLFYLRHWNVFLDVLIFAKTLKTVLKAKGR